MEKQPVSLVIITMNEEKNIERCIKSALPLVDDIVVVDSGSQDRTVDIARRLGARVSIEPWRGFAKQKTRATALARYDWVLSLDADEALSPQALEELQNLVKSEISADAYALPRKTYHLGRWMLHSGMYPDYQTRFFNRTRAKWSDTEVHEKILAEKIVRLKSDIHHWSFASLAHHVETVNKYSGLRAQDFKNQGKKYSGFRMLVKGISKFVELYFFKRGFLDGKAGLIVSVVGSFGVALRWAKLYEMELRDKSQV
jgi:glycosyltransferase involved in cell wall biosynthesis